MDFIERAVDYAISGKPGAFLFLLFAIVAGLIYDRRQLIRKIERRDDQLLETLDQYHQGQISVTEALKRVELVLTEVNTRLEASG